MAEGFEALKEEYLRQMRETYAARPSPAGDAPAPPEEPAPPEHGTESEEALVQTAEPWGEPPDGGSGLADIPLPPDSAPPPEMTIVDETEVLDPNPVSPDHLPEESGEGRLLVKVVTARGAYPVPGARVVVTRTVGGKETLQGYDETGESGQTRVFTLPAPPARLSMSPDNQTPYARYTVTVSAKGYIPAEYRGVPVFDGVQSVQQADIQPLLEGQPGEVRSYDVQQQGVESDGPDGYRKEGQA